MALSGQRIVIIGGSSGMGLAAARAAAAAGAAVTIASSNQGRLKAALAELPDTCEGVAVNTRDEADIAALFDRVGELDHVVYTAGDTVRPQPLADLPLATARDLFEVRFWGVRHGQARGTARPAGRLDRADVRAEPSDPARPLGRRLDPTHGRTSRDVRCYGRRAEPRDASREHRTGFDSSCGVTFRTN